MQGHEAHPEEVDALGPQPPLVRLGPVGHEEDDRDQQHDGEQAAGTDVGAKTAAADTVIAAAHTLMRRDIEGLLTIIVPRHPERGSGLAATAARGFGLVGLRERVAALGGRLSVAGRDTENGVMLIAEIPLPVTGHKQAAQDSLSTSAA